MSDPLGRIRGHVYPRSRVLARSGSLHASDIILGMLGVMLAVLAAAYGITLASH